MALKVIGAGFGRTGTLSTKAALEQLGFTKCHHMLEVFPSKKQLDAWHAIGEGETPDWASVFEGYQANVDFPSAGYWREISAHYPDAKILLTTRSFESWYESASETIYPVTEKMPAWMMIIPKARQIREMTNATIWERVFHGKFEDKEYARKIFEQHEADVKAAFGPEKLLVFHPKEGWEPLCRFLNVPVPETPFPNVNDRADFQKRISMMKRLQLVPWVVGGLVLAGVAAAVFAFQ